MSSAPEYVESDEVEQFDLTCPACGADLLADETYAAWRVCGGCNRHFWVSARERAAMIARASLLIELPYTEPRVDAVEQHQRLSAADRQDDARERTALADAVVTARVSVGGGSAIAALLDAVLLPGGLGIVTTDKVISAIRAAMRERLPMVIVCGGGSQSGPSGLLLAAQSLRLSAAIAELHRAGLPLIAVLTHPTDGNLLSGIVVNADLRIAEPGMSGARDVRPDEIVSRPELVARIAAILEYLRLRGGPDVVLAGSDDGANVRLATFGAHPAVAIAINADNWSGTDHWNVVRRAERTAANLNLPIVVPITGRAPFPLHVQAELRDLLLRHRSPTIGVLHGDVNPSHLNLLAVDAVLAEGNLALPGSKAKRFTAQEARAAGLVDAVTGSESAEAIERAMLEANRQAPFRRRERRLRQMERRGSESVESSEITRLELRDLRDLQVSVLRSVEDWRQRFEQREFNLPTLSDIQALPAFRNFQVPKLQMTKSDFVEFRERILHRRRATQPEEDSGEK
jgi:acetyl-CoA carboxylase carboxyl transferase subunit beta